MTLIRKTVGGDLGAAYSGGTEFKKRRKEKQDSPGRRQNKLENLSLLLMPTRGRLRAIRTQNSSLRATSATAKDRRAGPGISAVTLPLQHLTLSTRLSLLPCGFGLTRPVLPGAYVSLLA